MRTSPISSSSPSDASESWLAKSLIHSSSTSPPLLRILLKLSLASFLCSFFLAVSASRRGPSPV